MKEVIMANYISMVERLMNEGMALKHAVNLVAGAYGLDIDELYKQLARKGK
jgi:hypothetical protein